MEVLSKYGLHDTQIQNILINDNGLSLIFNQGIYILKDHKEYLMTNPCQLDLKILYFSPLKLYEHIEIVAYKKNKFFELNFHKFLNLLMKYSFSIDDVLYSSFSNSLLLKGYVDKSRIDFVVSEIKEIEVQFFEK